MGFEQLKKTIKLTNLIPPSIVLQESENSSENVSAIGSTSSIAGKTTISDDHKNSSRVIQYNI